MSDALDDLGRELWEAHGLGVPIAWFFEGLPTTADLAFEDQADALATFMAMPDAMTIIKVWPGLGHKRRKEASALIEAMGGRHRTIGCQTARLAAP